MMNRMRVIDLCDSMLCMNPATAHVRLLKGKNVQNAKNMCGSCLAKVKQAHAERDPSWPKIDLDVTIIQTAPVSS